jgi:hypothetical protein
VSDRDLELRVWCQMCHARCVQQPCLSNECLEMRPHRHFRCTSNAMQCLLWSTPLVVLLHVDGSKVQL